MSDPHQEQSDAIAAAALIAAGEHPVTAWRDVRQITQLELAEAAGFQPIVVSGIEDRTLRPSIDQLEQLAFALGVGVEDIQ